MSSKKYIFCGLLIVGVGCNYNYAESQQTNDKSGTSTDVSQNTDLIKTLPTALLENLQRDLQEQENKSNKTLENIAGISKTRLENEIMCRKNEDRSTTVGTRTIDPKKLPGDLLKYIAEHGVSYEGCNPQDATNEISERLGIAEDLPGVVATKIQEETTKTEQQKAAEEFSKREDAEDLNVTMSEIEKNTKDGKDPGIVKQAELVNEKEKNSSAGDKETVDALRDAMVGETKVTAPHGYDEKKQTERSEKELKEAQAEVEKREIIPSSEKKMTFWDKIIGTVKGWFSGTEKKEVSEEEEKNIKELSDALTKAMETD